MQIARRFTNPSFSLSNRVFTEFHNVGHWRNNQWRGRSFTASVRSEVPKAHKGRKRIPKDERQAMMESFVNKYRAMNAGKFPTVSFVKKEIGGGYYATRKILQELEYKSKTSPPMDENMLRKEVAKENKLMNEGEVSSSQMTVDAGLCEDSQSIFINDVENGSKTSTKIEETLSEEVIESITMASHSDVGASQGLLEGETKEVIHPCTEKLDDVKREETSENLLDFESTKHDEEYQRSPELNKVSRDVPVKNTENEEITKEPSFWGNIKNSIINMWRKL